MAIAVESSSITKKNVVVSIKDIFKIYRQADIETVVLRGTDLEVTAGEFLVILGRSGAGKTTLLNLIGGLDIPNAGQITINGIDISKLGEVERAQFRKQNIGIIFQTGNLIPFLTAIENVSLPMEWAGIKPSEARRRAKALLTELGLENRMDHKARQLSGGEAQRVGIAIALANRPSILLADELTGELDSKTAEGVMKLIARLHKQQQSALIVVTHNRYIAQQADRVIHLDNGIFQEESYE